MIAPIPAAVIAAVGTVTLAVSANVYETWALVRERCHQEQTGATEEANAWRWNSSDECLAALQGMKRKELKKLFLHCEAPDLQSGLALCDGEDGWEYDGFLLDNGPILTPTTAFITNRLFGRGRTWLGKSLSTAGAGVNRFREEGDGELLDRRFDYAIEPSALGSASAKSLFLRYAPRCDAPFPMSLIWRGMVDELRVVSLESSSEGTKALLLGMGCFDWSGGVWNASPFCLVARKCKEKRQ